MLMYYDIAYYDTDGEYVETQANSLSLDFYIFNYDLKYIKQRETRKDE